MTIDATDISLLPCLPRISLNGHALKKLQVALGAIALLGVLSTLPSFCGYTSPWFSLPGGFVSLCMAGLLYQTTKGQKKQTKRPIKNVSMQNEISTRLPDEIVKLIFNGLNVNELTQAFCVCKQWKRVGDAKCEKLWQEIYSSRNREYLPSWTKEKFKQNVLKPWFASYIGKIDQKKVQIKTVTPQNGHDFHVSDKHVIVHATDTKEEIKVYELATAKKVASFSKESIHQLDGEGLASCYTSQNKLILLFNNQPDRNAFTIGKRIYYSGLCVINLETFEISNRIELDADEVRFYGDKLLLIYSQEKVAKWFDISEEKWAEFPLDHNHRSLTRCATLLDRGLLFGRLGNGDRYVWETKTGVSVARFSMCGFLEAGRNILRYSIENGKEIIVSKEKENFNIYETTGRNDLDAVQVSDLSNGNDVILRPSVDHTKGLDYCSTFLKDHHLTLFRAYRGEISSETWDIEKNKKISEKQIVVHDGSIGRYMYTKMQDDKIILATDDGFLTVYNSSLEKTLFRKKMKSDGAPDKIMILEHYILLRWGEYHDFHIDIVDLSKNFHAL